MTTSNAHSPELEDLLNRVRLMQRYFAEADAESSRYIVEQLRPPDERIGIRDLSLLGLSRGNVRVSVKASRRGIFSMDTRHLYQVVERDAVRLEFTDIVHKGGAEESRTLEAVHKYEPGDWERRLEPAYQKCLDIQNVRAQIPLLERQLRAMENPEEVVRVVEGAKEPKYVANLLLLTSNYNSNSAILSWAYLALGKVSEAIRVLSDASRLHPKDAQLKLSLGNFYWAALCNAKGWAPGLDPGPLRQITLEMLHLSDSERVAPGAAERLAYGSAEALFENAVRLSTDRKTAERARQQLETLRMMDDSYGITGDR